jgi:sulfocyanin
MAVARVPHCKGLIFHAVSWCGSFATTAGKRAVLLARAFSVVGVVGVVVIGGSPVAARAQGGTAASAPVVDPAWLQVDSTTKTVTFQLVAGLTGLNGALNFNGFRDGGLTLQVPLGWTVVIQFRNHDGMLPHSAEVIAETHPLPTAPVAPAFPRAFTIRLDQGLVSEQSDGMRFIADKGGNYLIFCGVPGHGAAGMWIRLDVSGSFRTASLVVTPAGKP